MDWKDWVLQCTGTSPWPEVELVQRLWGGYGQLLRLTWPDGRTLILKQVEPPPRVQESASDRRKRRSYEVEHCFYRDLAGTLPGACRVARPLGQRFPCLLLLEDLCGSGLSRRRSLGPEQISSGLAWLAHFHAHFLGQNLPGLWEQGSYWHLETRAEEWARMPEGPLKSHAADFDRLLRGARFQTLLHGDAKPANFLWSDDARVAAVDFQYLGPGCGIRDVAYFLDGCLGQEQPLEGWLRCYFRHLRSALECSGRGHLAGPLEEEWRRLFPVAWSDYARFWVGWSASASPGRATWEFLQQALRLISPSSPSGLPQ